VSTVGKKVSLHILQCWGTLGIWLEQTAGLAITISKTTSHVHKSMCREVQQQDHTGHGSQLNFALNTSTPNLMWCMKGHANFACLLCIMGSHLVEDWTSSSRVFPLCAMKMSMWLTEKQQQRSARKLLLIGELAIPSRSEAI